MTRPGSRWGPGVSPSTYLPFTAVVQPEHPAYTWPLVMGSSQLGQDLTPRGNQPALLRATRQLSLGQCEDAVPRSVWALPAHSPGVVLPAPGPHRQHTPSSHQADRASLCRGSLPLTP